MADQFSCRDRWEGREKALILTLIWIAMQLWLNMTLSNISDVSNFICYQLTVNFIIEFPYTELKLCVDQGALLFIKQVVTKDDIKNYYVTIIIVGNLAVFLLWFDSNNT